MGKKLELRLAAGDFYGALQMYKTLFMRFLKGDEPSAEQQEKAAALALDAALKLVEHDQNTAATEMANLMVSVFADFHHPVDDAHKQRVRLVAAAFEPKPQFSADLAVFLKNAVKWSAAEGARKRGDPELQLLLARAYRTAGDFTHAMKHFCTPRTRRSWPTRSSSGRRRDTRVNPTCTWLGPCCSKALGGGCGGGK